MRVYRNHGNLATATSALIARHNDEAKYQYRFMVDLVHTHNVLIVTTGRFKRALTKNSHAPLRTPFWAVNGARIHLRLVPVMLTASGYPQTVVKRIAWIEDNDLELRYVAM